MWHFKICGSKVERVKDSNPDNTHENAMYNDSTMPRRVFFKLSLVFVFVSSCLTPVHSPDRPQLWKSI